MYVFESHTIITCVLYRFTKRIKQYCPFLLLTHRDHYFKCICHSSIQPMPKDIHTQPLHRVPFIKDNGITLTNAIIPTLVDYTFHTFACERPVCLARRTRHRHTHTHTHSQRISNILRVRGLDAVEGGGGVEVLPCCSCARVSAQYRNSPPLE